MDKWRFFVKMTLSMLALWPSLSFARDHIVVVGSSTVFPLTAAAAEHFGREKPFRTPIVEANGTGGGFKMFCAGVGERYPDISDASRQIKPSEVENCTAHGIHDMAEITIGYDGIVIANARSSPDFKLTRRALFLALAREVPKDGKLVTNPYTNWHDVDPRLPDMPIVVYGPPPAEGTRDAFVELVMNEGCKLFPEYKTLFPDDAARKQHCDAMREDGRFIELLGGNLMVQKLINNTDALGVFSYSYLDQNQAEVKANSVDGVLPSFETISNHRYSVARNLYIYVKREHLAIVPGLKEFVEFMLSDTATGTEGFLVVKGLIPLPEPEHGAMQKKAAQLQ